MKGHCCNFNIFILFSVLFYLFLNVNEMNVNEMFEINEQQQQKFP